MHVFVLSASTCIYSVYTLHYGYVDTVFALQKQKLIEQNMYRNEARRRGEVDMELSKDFKDLSTVHTPIGGLFESPKVRELCLYTVPDHFVSTENCYRCNA